jgi:hypothetical protein
MNANQRATATITRTPITVTGSWNGTLNMPNGGFTGCEAQTIGFTLTLTEYASQNLAGSTSNGRTVTSGHRKGNALTVSLNTLGGARGPYQWTWNGSNTITGSMAYFCSDNASGAILTESTKSFTVSK